MFLHERIFLETQNIRMIHWNAVGLGFDSLHQHTNDIIEQLMEDYDDVVELSIASGGDITNPMVIKGLEHSQLLEKQSFTCSEGYKYLKTCLSNVLNSVHEISKRDNIEQGLKTKLDSMAEWITKEVNFKLTRVLATI